VIPTGTELVDDLLAFSADGSLVATVGTVDRAAMQLQVFSTSSGEPVTWGSQPARTLCTDIAFMEPNGIFTHLAQDDGKRAVYYSTAESAAQHVVDATYFVLRSNRFLLFTTSGASAIEGNGVTNLSVLDLWSSSLLPVKLGSSVKYFEISDDLQAMWMMDDYDPEWGYGRLNLVSLPDGASRMVSPSAYIWGAAFMSGTHELLFFGDGMPNQVGGPLYHWATDRTEVVEADAVNFFGRSDPPTLYVTTAAPLAIHARAVGFGVP
jgi:hypothetical protein